MSRCGAGLCGGIIRKHRQTALRLLWWVYLALLFLLVVVKFQGSFAALAQRIRLYQTEGFVNYNLIPLRSVRVQVAHLPERWALMNLAGNLLPFLPFGALLPAAYWSFRSLGRVLAAGFLSVLVLECFQLVTKLGSFDVDDILLNLIGIALGYSMLLMLRRLSPH